MHSFDRLHRLGELKAGLLYALSASWRVIIDRINTSLVLLKLIISILFRKFVDRREQLWVNPL